MALADPVEWMVSTDQFIAWIFRELGAPVIKVELAPVQIIQQMHNGKRLLNRYLVGDGQFMDYHKFDLVAGQQRYNLPLEVQSVVKFLPSDMLGNMGYSQGEYMFTNMNYMTQNGTIFPNSGMSNSADLVGYEISMEFLRMMEFQFDTSCMWRYDSNRNELLITPAPQSDGVAVVRCYKKQEVVNLLNNDLYQRYVLAKCKQLWGRHLTKYNLTLPGGATLDGSTILQEGIQEEKDVRDRIDIEAEDLGYFTWG